MNESADRLQGKRIGFAGKLGAMSRREACVLIRQHGGMPLDRISGDIDLVVIGADELPDEDVNDLLSPGVRDRIGRGATTLIHEHELWLQLGLFDDSSQQQLYTPAMVAGLIKTQVRNIRRWHRMGLLQSVKIAHRLAYFDFEQVQSARRLADWVTQGAKPSEIRKQLHEFGPRVSERSLLDLDLVFDGRRVLLRENGRLISAHGQLHLDFESLDASEPREVEPITIALPDRSSGGAIWPSSGAALPAGSAPMTREEMLLAAEELEDLGQLESAIEWYRVLLAQHGPQAEIVFQLAELLYRSGDVAAARERYYNAIEIDEDFVEARVNLGCVLAETGQSELAIAAFAGALARDDHYPDVHYHLARSLDEVGSSESATRHWLRFLQLSPQSPWAEEALERLGKL